jgi:excisionase family DNA binding protein
MRGSEVHSLGDLPVMLTVEQLGQVLRVSRAKSYQILRQPGFPAVRLGRAIRIPREALRCWLERQMEGPAAG